MSDNWSNKGAICPHCQHVNEPSGDNYYLFSDECDEWDCDSCGKTFAVEVFTSYSWTTSRLDEDD